MQRPALTPASRTTVLHMCPGAHSALEVQVTVQALFRQACGAQSTAGPATQRPAPSHVDAPTRLAILPGLQAADAQVVPAGYLVQWPAPSHIPVVPQLVLPMSLQRPFGSARPAGEGAQVPAFPATLQALQAPQDALWQHTWSVQAPLKQSPLVVHAAPSGLRSLQVPDWQAYPAAQSDIGRCNAQPSTDGGAGGAGGAPDGSVADAGSLDGGMAGSGQGGAAGAGMGTGGQGGDTGMRADGGGTTGAGGGSTDGPDGPRDGTADGANPGGYIAGGGCDCSTTGDSTPLRLLAWAVVGALGWARRRRSRRR